MGCSTCGGKSSGTVRQSLQPNKAKKLAVKTITSSDCDYSGGILRVWLAALECVKNSGQLAKISLTTHQANVHLGNLQTAINHPDNYCLFKDRVQDFQNNILPRIIADVQACL